MVQRCARQVGQRKTQQNNKQNKGSCNYRNMSYQGDGDLVEDGLTTLVDELGRAGKADGGDLLGPAILGSSGNDLGLDGKRATGEVSTQAM